MLPFTLPSSPEDCVAIQDAPLKVDFDGEEDLAQGLRFAVIKGGEHVAEPFHRSQRKGRALNDFFSSIYCLP